MSYRYMRVFVFFDLPTNTGIEKREYRHFRKHLIVSGFMMLQESVYVKLVPNDFMVKAVINNIKKHKPSSGLVQILKVTEKQFAAIDNVVGITENDIINSDERLIVL